jgi:SsrA-binding protein
LNKVEKYHKLFYMPTLVTNKRARFDYDILATLEAGLVLQGQEVKSVKAGSVSLKGAFVTMRNNEAWLTNAHISKYPQAGPLPDYDPTRNRKILLNRRELKSLIGKRKEAGLTLLPLSLYTKRNRIKVSIGIGRGKKKYEKRETIKKRDIDREIRQRMKR